MTTEILSKPFTPSGNRDRTFIEAVVLDLLVVSDMTQTEIMYKAYLSWEQTKSVTTSIVKDGLADFNGKTYSITGKGKRYLSALLQSYEIRKEGAVA